MAPSESFPNGILRQYYSFKNWINKYIQCFESVSVPLNGCPNQKLNEEKTLTDNIFRTK